MNQTTSKPDNINNSAIPPVTPVIHQPTVKPVVTYVLMGVTIFIYLLQYASQFLTGTDYPYLLGGKINDLILQGQVWRFITPVLLHGSILHIGFNMYALYVIGGPLERHFGHFRFFALYLAGGFSGNVLSFIFTANPSLGSSTAIFGLLAAEGVFIYQNKKFFGKDARRMLINTITIAVINFVIGLSTTMIDNWGHLGGLLGGALFTWIAGPVWGIEGLFPTFNIIDERSHNRIWYGGIAVGITFSIFAIVKVLLVK
jgi:rhomboid protease GluP